MISISVAYIPKYSKTDFWKATHNKHIDWRLSVQFPLYFAVRYFEETFVMSDYLTTLNAVSTVPINSTEESNRKELHIPIP